MNGLGQRDDVRAVFIHGDRALLADSSKGKPAPIRIWDVATACE